MATIITYNVDFVLFQGFVSILFDFLQVILDTECSQMLGESVHVGRLK